MLKNLAYDRVSSSNQIALKMLDCAVELFGCFSLEEYMKEIMNSQSGMAVVLNIADRICKAKSIEEIKELKAEFLKAEEKAVAAAFKYLEGVDNLATISFSKSVLDVLLKIKPKRVFVSVSHPAREGEALAERLTEEGIKVVLFEDSAYSLIMKETDAVLIGADALFDLCVVNKIGSYALALLAMEFEKPFYVVANKFKVLDGDVERFYRISKMDPKEISNINCDIINVYFECVPKRLIKRIFMG